MKSGVIERIFRPDHPAADGHFPGNPLIPGALLLSEALGAIAGELGIAAGPFQVRSAKFLRPVRPGERVRIEYASDALGEIRFDCAVGGREVLIGRMTCGVPSTAK